MADIFVYIEHDDQVKDAVACGLKLSENITHTIEYMGEAVSCIQGWLNPADDENGSGKTCLRLEVAEYNCVIGDGILYQLGIENAAFMERFKSSLVKYKDYHLGQYRLPMAFVTCSVISRNVYKQGKRPDIPMFYNKSEDYYTECILEEILSTGGDARDRLLYSYFMAQYENGNYDIINCDKSNEITFFNKEWDKYYTVKNMGMKKE